MWQVTAAPRSLAPVRDRLRGVADAVARLPRPAPPAWVLVVAFVAIVTWPVSTSPPTSGGFDISWITALHVAAHRGLHFGSQFNYTYGPLGYLTIGNLYYDRTGIPADLVTGALYVGVLVLMARPLCRSLGIVGGALLVFVLARLAATPIDPVELVTPLVVALGIIALQRDPAELRPLQAAGIAVLAAFSALGKLSAGPVGLAVVLVLAAVSVSRPSLSRRERLRAAGLLLGSFVGGLLILWLLAGQSLFDLPAYARNAFDVILGYDDPEAMGDPSLNWQYTWAAVATVVVLAVAVWRDRDLPLPRRLGTGLLWVLFVWIAFRHAFVRLAPGHAVLFFGPLAIVAAAVLFREGSWRAPLLACLLPLVAIWDIAAWNVPNLFSVTTTGFVQQVNLLLGPNLRHSLQSQTFHTLRSSYGLPRALIARLSGQTVDFDPSEAAMAWAFPEFRWNPPPVFQSYVAYTSHLDDLNADFLAGPRAPRYILRQNLALDQRNPRFESPRYMLEMICRYRQVETIPGWGLLERGTDRCGTAAPAGSRRVTFGQRVFAPAPTKNSIVVARFTDFSQPVGDSLAKLLFKRRAQWIALNQATFRFVSGHADNPHVLSFPSCLGWSPAVLDPTPYQWIGIGHLPQLTQPGTTESGYSYRVSFERIPFRCAG